MEEILYWVKTKRAPCLYKYDFVNQKNNDAHCSKNKCSINNVKNGSPKKRKKRKLSIFDDSESEQNQKNVYFENTTHPVPQATVLSISKDSIISETDLNIKRAGNVKCSKIRKVDTQQIPSKLNQAKPESGKKDYRTLDNIQNLDSSLESGLFSGETKNKQSSVSKSVSKKSADKPAVGDSHKNKESTKVEKKQSIEVLNPIFDDLSDVSGFTANYIRSTKQNSFSKKLDKTKKTNTHLIKESQDNHKTVKKFTVCVDKSSNTVDAKHTLNDTDPYNVLNLVSKEEKHVNGEVKLNKSTSLLKFLEPKTTSQEKQKRPKRCSQKVDLDASFQSKSSGTSRYFTRSKVSSSEDLSMFQHTSTPIKNSKRKTQNTKSNNSKTSITRSLRSKTLNETKPVLVLDNVDRASSSGSVNVAQTKRPSTRNSVKDKLRKSEQSNCKNNSVSTLVRDKSGYTACFSDSDEDLPKKLRFFT